MDPKVAAYSSKIVLKILLQERQLQTLFSSCSCETEFRKTSCYRKEDGGPEKTQIVKDLLGRRRGFYSMEA